MFYIIFIEKKHKIAEKTTKRTPFSVLIFESKL